MIEDSMESSSQRESVTIRSWTEGSIAGNLLMLSWPMVVVETLYMIGQVAEMFFLGIGLGLGGGAGVLVGQNLGAGRPKRAERSGWVAASLMEVSMIVFSLMIWLKAENIVGVFTTEPDLVMLGSIFLRIATVGYLVFGLVLVFQDCIAGAGDTLPTMIVSIAMIWMIQLPLAFFLPKVGDLGVFGVRWAIVISLFAGAFFISYTLCWGDGKQKRFKKENEIPISGLCPLLKRVYEITFIRKYFIFSGLTAMIG
jgi:Na+-driven multidrug efflux pump